MSLIFDHKFCIDKYKDKGLFLTGLLLSFSLCLDLGIVNVYLVKTGIEKGGKLSFIAGVGSSFGDIIYAGLTFLGIGYLVQFETVRWIIWIGGTIALIGLSGYMLHKTFVKPIDISTNISITRKSAGGEFLKGLILALSSPSSIVWFATVGGAIIATTEFDKPTDLSWLLIGFFSASIIWSASIAIISHYTGSFLGTKLLKTMSLLAALIFAILALKVGYDGYVGFIR
jgi:L-lysine exporter family protein LysE/ArgO